MKVDSGGNDVQVGGECERNTGEDGWVKNNQRRGRQAREAGGGAKHQTQLKGIKGGLSKRDVMRKERERKEGRELQWNKILNRNTNNKRKIDERGPKKCFLLTLRCRKLQVTQVFKPG